MDNKKITFYDVTLRDGNHAINQQLNAQQIVNYAKAADIAGIEYVELGHGNGLGASSLQAGKGLLTTNEMLKLARPCLKNSRMSTFMLPGWGTMKELDIAIDNGLDAVRFGAHCTEANMTERYIKYLAKESVESHGILVMSHMATPERLAEEARLMESYGADKVGFFDSSGHYLPEDVTIRIEAIRDSVKIPVLFHAHNNLGMAIANSIAAARAGAEMIDGCIRGLGAGSGNAQLEVLVAVFNRMGYDTGIDLDKILDAADQAKDELNFHAPTIISDSIVSGIAGVFSGFRPKAIKIAKEYSINVREILYELGRRKAVAGQEDQIIEVAQCLKNT